MARKKTFKLDEMHGLILVLTGLVFPLPLLMGALALKQPMLWSVTGFLVLIWAFIYLYMRPSRFEVSDAALEIVWPLRRLRVARSEIESVESIMKDQFVSTYGRGMRVGAGGLFGGFGLLVTKKVTFQFYISRTDRYVIVRRKNGRPLLLTPERVENFVEMLR